MKNECIVLLVACDNHLVVMLAALLKSIEMTHVGREDIELYIISDGITDRNIKKLNSTIDSENIRLFWKDLKQVLPPDVSLPLDQTSFPVCAYARLCAPYVLPTDIRKVIYLDVDTLVMRDISNLWHIDIGDFVVAAVKDRAETVGSPWGGILNYKELGLNPNSHYFNSGIMVINLDKWRNMDAASLVIAAVKTNAKHVTFADQYGLNVVFAEEWYELDRRWNCYSQNSIDDPFIIHFTGMKPIFKGYNFNKEYRKTFYLFLGQTPWARFRPISDYLRLAQKFRNVISKKIKRNFLFRMPF